MQQDTVEYISSVFPHMAISCTGHAVHFKDMGLGPTLRQGQGLSVTPARGAGLEALINFQSGHVGDTHNNHVIPSTHAKSAANASPEAIAGGFCSVSANRRRCSLVCLFFMAATEGGPNLKRGSSFWKPKSVNTFASSETLLPQMSCTSIMVDTPDPHKNQSCDSHHGLQGAAFGAGLADQLQPACTRTDSSASAHKSSKLMTASGKPCGAA